MDRKEFLVKLGLGVAAIAFMDTLQGCSKNTPSPNNAPAALNVNFTFLLTDATYAALRNVGGYVYTNGVIVARTATNTYIAVAQACTHAGCDVVYELQQNDFYCPCHGSVFNASGAVTVGPASYSLQLMTVKVTGNSVNVHS
ncbi:MAG: Rieske 2Fe-2S domain-containing protein [Bacteroidota bacterium]